MSKETEFIINEAIKKVIDAPYKVKALSDRNEYLGEMTLDEALQRADEDEVDVILTNAKSTPPMVVLQELDKYKYNLKKKQKQNKANQKTTEQKEVRFSPSIDTHDLDIKKNQILKFIEQGNTVKITMRFRGREIAFAEHGREQLSDLVTSMSPKVKVIKPLNMEGRFLSVLIAKA